MSFSRRLTLASIKTSSLTHIVMPPIISGFIVKLISAFFPKWSFRCGSISRFISRAEIISTFVMPYVLRWRVWKRRKISGNLEISLLYLIIVKNLCIIGGVRRFLRAVSHNASTYAVTEYFTVVFAHSNSQALEVRFLQVLYQWFPVSGQ